MRRNVALAIVAVLAVAGLITWVAGTRATRHPVNLPGAEKGNLATKIAPQRGKGAESPIAVEVATARAATTTTDIRAIGGLQSDELVQISSEIAGRVAEFNFTEGAEVGAGDVLIKLDDALARAELADAQARYDLAAANNERATRLSRTGNVTEKAIDEATASFGIARAALELQRVRLAKHTIKAPFPGRVGLRNVSPGAFVAIGTPIVNLEKIDNVKVDFKLPELFLPAVDAGQTVEITIDALPRQRFTGKIYAIDPQVDVNGRALQLRARIPNADFVLRPGLFARIVVKGKQSREVVLAPESAIVPRGGETFVYTIENGRAIEAKVKLGERRGAEVEILDGLVSGTQIVTAGQLKLRNDVPIEIVDAGTPAPAVRSAKQ